jgi:amino acid adenylation domain-containing protein
MALTEHLRRRHRQIYAPMPNRRLGSSPLDPDVKSSSEMVLETRTAPGSAERSELSRRSAVYPASLGQQRLWILDQLDHAAGAAYHLASGWRLQGSLDEVSLRAALDTIVNRHAVLRTSFALLDEQPMQLIGPADAGFHWVEHDLAGVSAEAQGDRIHELSARAASEPFDLSAGPLIRGRLLRLAADDHLLLITQHHIISDGWSEIVLRRELAALYAAFSQGQDNPLPPLEIQYTDYALWQRQWLRGQQFPRQLEFWKSHLDGAPALLQLPTDRPRAAVQTYAGSTVELTLSPGLTAALRRLSRRHGVTLFMTLLAGWSALLSRISGQNDVVVGTPIANRPRREFESLLGFFANTLALRVRLLEDPSVAELLRQIRTTTLEAYAHQEMPFAQVVEALQPARSLSHNPIFQAMLAYHSASGEEPLSLPGIKVSEFRPARRSSIFDLTLWLRDVGERIEGALEYATALFEHATIERIATHLQALLEAMVEDDQQRISRLNLLSAAQRRQLLVGFNETHTPYESGRCIHELFEARAASVADAPAVLCEDGQLSFGELNRRANQLAHYLIGMGVRPDDRVAICMQRGLELMVGLLGILKAGGAYVPLDPAYPQQRLAYMLEDSTPVAVLTQPAARAALPPLNLPVVILDLQDADSIIAQAPHHNPAANALGLTSSHLAYVIYTSGSTGLPKGVMIEHRSVVNLLCAMACKPGLRDCDVLLAVTTLSFDIAGLELYLPLVSGARLLLASRSAAADAQALSQLIRRHGVTVMQATPATWRLLLGHGWQGSVELRVLCGGEALPAEVAEHLVAHNRELWNLYGPTETTIWSTMSRFHGSNVAATASIGRPIANTKIYILDARGEPVPIGVVGEIHIGGAGVARGYLNLPELTAQRFVADPFNNALGARMYKTGDLGRWHSDGNIEFMGRNDCQVKIRGFRIELGEIEARLAACPGVHEAQVLTREDSAGGQRLVAYVTEQTSAELSATQLRSQLSIVLPEYMVPSAFVILASLPLTPNGKLDRKALPAPDQSAVVSAEYQAPVGQMEQAMAQIWQTLLGLSRIGRDDNFFELGGHSLAALRLVARVASTFGAKIGVAALFASPTLRAFANRVSDVDRPPESWNIVRVQPLGTKTPIIAINNTMMYYDLARKIGTDRRFLAVQLFDPANPRPLPSRSLEAITTDYVHLIREAQPHGPYILIGLCVAGLIAYEAARQLRQAGEPVALVVMADTWCPGYAVRCSFLQGIAFNFRRKQIYRRHRLALVRRGLMRIDEFLATTRLGKWHGLMRLLSAWRLTEDPSAVNHARSEDGWFLPALVSARDSYHPPASTGDVVLLQSNMIPAADFVDAKMGWSGLATGRLLHYRLPGWHDRMFHDEGVALIAEHLRPVLDHVDAESRVIED